MDRRVRHDAQHAGGISTKESSEALATPDAVQHASDGEVRARMCLQYYLGALKWRHGGLGEATRDTAGNQFTCKRRESA